MTVALDIPHRETWLHEAMPMVREHFEAASLPVPDKIRLTCGFPSKMGMGRKKRRVGECWPANCSSDGHIQIFVSPVIAEPVKVLGILVHEIVHACGFHGHRKDFAKAAASVGLEKPWTGTGESPELIETLNKWIKGLGPYPHGALDGLSSIKQEGEKGRMLKMECTCGLKIRTTQKWLDQYGPKWPCPCGLALVNSDMAESEEGE